jgi:HAD superfamily hydrolase (TIGR01509 family)
MPRTQPTDLFLFFDLGKVLVAFDHQVMVENLASLLSVPCESVWDLLFDQGLEDAYERGDITSETFAARLLAIGRHPVDHEELLDAAGAMFTVQRDMVPVLQRCRQAGVGMGLLSNTCEAHWEWLQRHPMETVVGWFDPIVLSYRVRAMKPDLSIYRSAEQMAGVAPESIFFIDDRAENVAGARAAGWRATQFVDASGLQQELDTILPPRVAESALGDSSPGQR